MKKIEDLFREHLEPEVAEKAIRNIDKVFAWYKPEQPNVEEAVMYSFSWKDSPEGDDYWLDVRKQLRTKKPDLSTALEGLEKSLKELQQAMNEVRQAITN